MSLLVIELLDDLGVLVLLDGGGSWQTRSAVYSLLLKVSGNFELFGYHHVLVTKKLSDTYWTSK